MISPEVHKPPLSGRDGDSCISSVQNDAPTRLPFRAAESTHEIGDQADQQNQANPAAADYGAAKVKPAATEQEKKNYNEQ